MTNYILEYWGRVQSGEVVACKQLKQQCKKIVDELENPRDPWVFRVVGRATQPIEFIETFCDILKVGGLAKR